MTGDGILISRLIEACRDVIVRNADYLCELDRAIGDGDHGTNMARGLMAVSAQESRLASLSLGTAISEAGMLLVMSIGGASGPLYGTLLLELGKAVEGSEDFATKLERAIGAVARRGKSQAGDKTLLDVLYPLQTAVSERLDLTQIFEKAKQAALMTIPMKAKRGRASYLGDRSIGHVDPGAASCALLAGAVCDILSQVMNTPEAACA